MGIFARITDIFKANINDILDKAEDPEKMIKQMVIEMEESVNKTTLAVAQAIANEVSLQKKLEKARKDSVEWEGKAMQALTASRDDLAKMVGTASESVIRVLSDFREEGIIEIETGKIKVLHPNKLEQVIKWNVARN